MHTRFSVVYKSTLNEHLTAAALSSKVLLSIFYLVSFIFWFSGPLLHRFDSLLSTVLLSDQTRLLWTQLERATINQSHKACHAAVGS